MNVVGLKVATKFELHLYVVKYSWFMPEEITFVSKYRGVSNIVHGRSKILRAISLQRAL